VNDFIDRLAACGDAVALVAEAEIYRTCDQVCDVTTYAELLEAAQSWLAWTALVLTDLWTHYGGVAFWGDDTCDSGMIANLVGAMQNHEITCMDERLLRKNIKDHPHVAELRWRNHPGLILATSGTSGEPKAVVHDLRTLIDQACERPGKAYRTLMMLNADHIGGINTILHTLAHGGTLVVPTRRDPLVIADVIERYEIELLPTTPTFLRLMLASGEHLKRDMTSLKVISYGAEPMPAELLGRIADAFPGVKLKQTYGMSEVGILGTKSMGNRETWVRIHTPYRVVHYVDLVTPHPTTGVLIPVGKSTKLTLLTGKGTGFLEVKAPTAMLGYIGAPDPFTADGWMPTGDEVEVKRENGVEWIRFLGRKSDTINVGGAKVYPMEVEEVICQVHGVVDAAVYAEPDSLVGEIVCAKVQWNGTGNQGLAKRAIRRHCRETLDKHKVPIRITFTDEPLHDGRGKKQRVR